MSAKYAGRVGNVVVSGAVEIAKRYEEAGRARVAADEAVTAYLSTPTYLRLQKALSDADSEWRKAGEDFHEARIK